MTELELVDFHIIIKEVFGSFAILNDISAEDMPKFYEFAKIVWNYDKMTNIDLNNV